LAAQFLPWFRLLGFMQMQPPRHFLIPAERHKLLALVLPRECLTAMRAAVGRVRLVAQEEAALAARVAG
jgi:hypothetical protein